MRKDPQFVHDLLSFHFNGEMYELQFIKGILASHFTISSHLSIFIPTALFMHYFFLSSDSYSDKVHPSAV